MINEDTQNKYRYIANITEVAEGKTKRIILDSSDKNVSSLDLLLCNVNNEYYVIENRCPHEDFPLHFGCLKEDQIECSLHGARYCVKSGLPRAEPADIPIKSYLIKIRENGIFVKI